MGRAPLQGLSESKKFWAWTKCKDRRRATRFAQTISPSVLTSMSGTSRFTKTLPKSPCPHPQPQQKGSRNETCFLLYRLEKSSNDQLRKTEARQESLTMCKSFQPRLCFLQPVYSLTSPLKRPENSPISKYFLRGGGLWAADFGWGLVKLGVPGRDVGADGEIV